MPVPDSSKGKSGVDYSAINQVYMEKTSLNEEVFDYRTYLRVHS